MDDWDLIVVGAGSAGAVIAARVTEDPGRRVLLIEAGPGYPDRTSLADDPTGVVDQYGRVFGVEGLYVVDASIMPTIPCANTNIATIVIGERFGEWLREDAV